MTKNPPWPLASLPLRKYVWLHSQGEVTVIGEDYILDMIFCREVMVMINEKREFEERIRTSFLIQCHAQGEGRILNGTFSYGFSQY